MKSLLTRLANKMTLAVAATAVALTWGDWKAVALAGMWSAWCVVEDLVVLRRTAELSSGLDKQVAELKADVADKFLRVQNKLGVKL